MNIYNVIILDESGSMSSIYKETLQSMNEVLVLTVTTSAAISVI